MVGIFLPLYPGDVWGTGGGFPPEFLVAAWACEGGGGRPGPILSYAGADFFFCGQGVLAGVCFVGEVGLMAEGLELRGLDGAGLVYGGEGAVYGVGGGEGGMRCGLHLEFVMNHCPSRHCRSEVIVAASAGRVENS